MTNQSKYQPKKKMNKDEVEKIRTEAYREGFQNGANNLEIYESDALAIGRAIIKIIENRIHNNDNE